MDIYIFKISKKVLIIKGNLKIMSTSYAKNCRKSKLDKSQREYMNRTVELRSTERVYTLQYEVT